MILGLGSDIIDIRRIEKTLQRFGDRFLSRVFTATEREKADRRKGTKRGRAATLAKRFAAKEACAKALGTGFRKGVAWRDLGVVNAPGGRPTLVLSGGAAARLAAMTPPGAEARLHLTMTDDHPWAEAVVVIEAVPSGSADARLDITG